MMPKLNRIRRSTLLVVMTCLTADASAQDVDTFISNWGSYLVTLYNFITVIFALIGVWMVVHALMGFYRASQEKQPGRIPVRAYWIALCVGSVLTSVSTAAAILKNTLTQ